MLPIFFLYLSWFLIQTVFIQNFLYANKHVKIYRKSYGRNFILKFTGKEGSTLYLTPTLPECHHSTANCYPNWKIVKPTRENYTKTILASRSTAFSYVKSHEKHWMSRLERGEKRFSIKIQRFPKSKQN